MAVPHLDEGGRRSRIQPVSHGSRSGGLETEASSLFVWNSAHTTGSRADVRIKVEEGGESRVKLSRVKALASRQADEAEINQSPSIWFGSRTYLVQHNWRSE